MFGSSVMVASTPAFIKSFRCCSVLAVQDTTCKLALGASCVRVFMVSECCGATMLAFGSRAMSTKEPRADVGSAARRIVG